MGENKRQEICFSQLCLCLTSTCSSEGSTEPTGLAVMQQGRVLCGCGKVWGTAELLWLMPPMMYKKPPGSTAHMPEVFMLQVLGHDFKEMNSRQVFGKAGCVALVETIPIAEPEVSRVAGYNEKRL